MTAEPGWLSAAELRAAYATGDLSPREVCIAVLQRAELLNPTLRAFLSFMGESALERAKAAEAEWSRRRRRGETREAPPLLGVPVSVKDTVDVAGAPTTMGSLLADGAPAAADELLVQRLRTSGAVLIGKTNTSEFGLAAQTTNRLGDPCVNPWNATRTAGGSSGGAGAACAAGLGPLHHGTDGGGSVRIPAAYCGVVGLKPTGRRLARWKRGAGLSQFEVDGALARTVQDTAISTLHTPLANLIQAPAIAVPTGFDGEGLPVSMQIVARPGDEATVLRCAAVLERALPWRDTRPATMR